MLRGGAMPQNWVQNLSGATIYQVSVKLVQLHLQDVEPIKQAHTQRLSHLYIEREIVSTRLTAFFSPFSIIIR